MVLRILLNSTSASGMLPHLRGLPSQVKGAGFRVQSRRCSWVRIPSPAPIHIGFSIITPTEFFCRRLDSFSRIASRMIEMSKKRLDICWEREASKEDFKPALRRYDRYLEENGIRESTRSSYVFRVGKFHASSVKTTIHP